MVVMEKRGKENLGFTIHRGYVKRRVPKSFSTTFMRPSHIICVTVTQDGKHLPLIAPTYFNPFHSL